MEGEAFRDTEQLEMFKIPWGRRISFPEELLPFSLCLILENCLSFSISGAYPGIEDEEDEDIILKPRLVLLFDTLRSFRKTSSGAVLVLSPAFHWPRSTGSSR